MALARLFSRGQNGLDAYEVSVEVHIAGGLPGFTITGLPTAAVRESRDRVRAALHTCAVPVPQRRVTVHLGPADIPKDGGRFDLAIALGIVLAERQPRWPTDDLEFLGELSLAGELRGVRGVLPATMAARRASRRLILPQANEAEAALIPDAPVAIASHLRDVLEELDGASRLRRPCLTAAAANGERRLPDLDDVGGHPLAKRALTIAAAGGHNLLMVGPPGSGKSMLAERLPALLPPLPESEWLEVASILSVSGERIDAASRARPFRAPHHSTPPTALVGGGGNPRPGEVTRAHRGVLFLDELPEFSRAALEALREPLESGSVTIARVRRQIRYPADFQLIAAMNPCPCGYFGDGTDRCECPPTRLWQYRGRVSGPLLDRFDLHIPVERIPLDQFGEVAPEHRAGRLRDAVAEARQRQLRARSVLNRELEGGSLWGCASLDADARRLLVQAEARWQLSTRSIVRVLRVSRTIADLDHAATISASHVGEALQHRCLDRPAPGDTL